jgi:hypothetical protein
MTLFADLGHQTSDGQANKIKYRPLFLDHFEKKDAEKLSVDGAPPAQVSPASTVAQPIPMTPEEQKRFESNLQRQLNQISAGKKISNFRSLISFLCFALL